MDSIILKGIALIIFILGTSLFIVLVGCGIYYT